MPRLRFHPDATRRLFSSFPRPPTSHRFVRSRLLRFLRRSATSAGRRTVRACRDRMDSCLCSIFLRSFWEGGWDDATATSALFVVVAPRHERRKRAKNEVKRRVGRCWIRGAGGVWCWRRSRTASLDEATKRKVETAPAGAGQEAARKHTRPRVARDVRLVDREPRTKVVQASGCDAVDVANCTWNQCTVKTK